MLFAGGKLLTCFYSFMTALFAALIMVPFLRQWALDKDTVDLPDARKVHESPMPRLGGIAIFLAFLFSAIIYLPINQGVRGILAGSLIVFATGVVDDLNGLFSRGKFAGQAAACLVTIMVGDLYLSHLGNLFGFGDVVLPAWVGIPFTVFAVVGVINAINLIDGLDGLAGGVTTIALMAFFLLGWLEDDPVTMILAAAMVGAIFGFLKYNFYPARIFMGDTGSLVVGYVIGFIAVYLTQRSISTTSPMVPVLILGLPLLDTVWVMMRRIMTGVSPFAADRTHVHHKFLSLGFEHRFAVIVIYGISLFWACFALLLHKLPEYLLLLIYLVITVSGYILLRYVIQNSEKFPFLNKDAPTTVRDTAIYRRMSDLSDKLLLGVSLSLVFYMVVAVLSTLSVDILPWQVALILLAAGAYLWFSPLTDNRQFLMLVVYATLGLAATQVWSADYEMVGGLTFKRSGDLLLGAAGLLAVVKIQFRKPGEFFLTTADYLALGVCIFMAIASQQAVLGYNINGPLFRTVVGIVALRTIITRDQATQSMVVGCSTVFLILVAVVGLALQ
jgi:UDP-GlcNAc:undecaprenyl-phosphate GlcNAc-1-phosphate transferase